ncbi:MAG: hypothetical protein ACPLTR_10135, partial [Thermacetogeniaceae bacterium]
LVDHFSDQMDHFLIDDHRFGRHFIFREALLSMQVFLLLILRFWPLEIFGRGLSAINKYAKLSLVITQNAEIQQATFIPDS